MAFVGSSIVATGAAVTFEVFNVVMATASTEYSQLLSSGTIVGYMIRAEDCHKLQVSHVATESGTKYVTVPEGSTMTDEHTYVNQTIYFQSPDDNVTAQIVVWKV